jgi:hypothetical protein
MSLSATITLSSDTRTTTGVLLLTLVAVEYGGLFVLRVVRGGPQRSFARAGHAHAGVLVISPSSARSLPMRPALDGVDGFPGTNGDLGGGHPVSGRLLPLFRRAWQDPTPTL